jgi:hypothetical protein
LRPPYGAAHRRRWLSSHKDQFVTERAGNEMPSGFRCGKRFCLVLGYPLVSMTFMPTRHPIHAETVWTRASTARAKGAIGRLDFHFTLVLSARGEPECAARSLNNRGAGTFVWIIHKLVEPNL